MICNGGIAINVIARDKILDEYRPENATIPFLSHVAIEEDGRFTVQISLPEDYPRQNNLFEVLIDIQGRGHTKEILSSGMV